MGDLIAERLSRRDILKGALATTAIAAVASPAAMMASSEALAADNTPSFKFKELEARLRRKPLRR